VEIVRAAAEWRAQRYPAWSQCVVARERRAIGIPPATRRRGRPRLRWPDPPARS